MMSELDFRGPERFTAFHAGLLVFCMDGAGCSLLFSGDAHPRSYWPLAWVGFLALTAYGGWLLILQHHQGRNYLLFGVLLMAVNSSLALCALIRGERPDRFGVISVAGILFGLGILVTSHAMVLRSHWIHSAARAYFRKHSAVQTLATIAEINRREMHRP